MSAAVRCLALVLIGWTGARAASLGFIPGGALFTLGHSEIAAAEVPRPAVPPLDPAVPLVTPAWPAAQQFADPGATVWRAPQFQPFAVPYYVPMPTRASSAPRQTPIGEYALYPPILGLEHWQLPRFASLPVAVASSELAAAPVPPLPVERKLDRIQLTTWALLRGRQGIGAPPRSLASGGALGGSQAGARLTYRFTPELAASLRTTSAVGTSQSEIAAGIRVTPVRSIPISFTAERRQAIGHYGGRSAFALFAEGGIYGQSLLGFDIDGYAQAGVVGARDRAFFADGAFAFTRPVYRQLSAGFGMWGGIQPGIYRVDAGPRISYRVRPNVKVHLDWRQRVAGSAMPGSGPAVTLAGDF